MQINMYDSNTSYRCTHAHIQLLLNLLIYKLINNLGEITEIYHVLSTVSRTSGDTKAAKID